MNNQEKLFIVKNANAVRRFLQLLQTSKNPVKLLNQAGHGVTTFNRGTNAARLEALPLRGTGDFTLNGRNLDYRELKKLLGQGSTVWNKPNKSKLLKYDPVFDKYVYGPHPFNRTPQFIPNTYRNPGGPLDRAGLGGPENMKLERGILDNMRANKNPHR
jgi:hypothetical protein